MTLESHHEVHLGKLLLAETMKGSVSLSKVEGIEAKEKTHSMQISGAAES